MELPSGTVAFLFSDIEGSTQLLRRLRDEYASLLGELDAVLRATFEEHGGKIVDSQADSFFVAFGRVRDAVAAAVDAQRATADRAWPDGVELRVRMGLHAGEPLLARERYVGLGVHKAARICGVAHGGQVLLSQSAALLLADSELPDLSLHDLGEHRLKDFDQPERLFQLVAEGLRPDFPPAPGAAEPDRPPALDYRVLGPVEVWRDGHQLSLRGSKLRGLLALLLLNANGAVSTDRLIDDLWSEHAPADGPHSVQVLVHELRRTLGRGPHAPQILVTRAEGYMLAVGAGELDLQRFQRLVDEALNALARGDAASASERLGEALRLWRGPALADLVKEPFAQPAIARLEELRLAALERRIEADLLLGRHVELVGELEELAARNPLVERFRGQLMLALYRAGRQAEALDVYQRTRKELVAELGLEPSPGLQRLEQAILRQDAELDPPTKARAAERVVPRAEPDPSRSILVVALDEDSLDGLVAVTEPLARSTLARELIVARLVEGGLADLRRASDLVSRQRDALVARGVSARCMSFTSPDVGSDIVRLTSEQDVDLLVLDCPRSLLGDGRLPADVATAFRGAPCDAVLVAARPLRADGGPIIVPFGGTEHDWAALELGAWIATATNARLALLGTTGSGAPGERDASRLLAYASIVVQRFLGVSAEPLLVEPADDVLLEAASRAQYLVVGLSERWQTEGLGTTRLLLTKESGSPVLLVRRGFRPSGFAPQETLTRFRWSLSTESAGRPGED